MDGRSPLAEEAEDQVTAADGLCAGAQAEVDSRMSIPGAALYNLATPKLPQNSRGFSEDFDFALQWDEDAYSSLAFSGQSSATARKAAAEAEAHLSSASGVR